MEARSPRNPEKGVERVQLIHGSDDHVDLNPEKGVESPPDVSQPGSFSPLNPEKGVESLRTGRLLRG